MPRSALARLRDVTWREWRTLARTVLTLGAARLLLWVTPFTRVRRLLNPRPGRVPTPWLTIELVRWAIKRAERIIPDATCLPQAITAEALLARAGIPCLLRVGVLKDARGTLRAHAWAESGRIIVVGNLHEQMRDYTRLPPLPPVWATDAGASA